MNNKPKFLSNEWLEYIIQSDSIISTHGFKDICQNTLNARKENNELRNALKDMVEIIDDHGDNIIKAHVNKILNARKMLNKEFYNG